MVPYVLTFLAFVVIFLQMQNERRILRKYIQTVLKFEQKSFSTCNTLSTEHKGARGRVIVLGCR